MIEEKQELIDYDDLKQLGFDEGFMNDDVHQRQFGYDDFWVEYVLSKKFTISWEHSTRLAEIQRYDKKVSNGCISERIPIKNIQEVRKYLHVFGHLTNEEYKKYST